MIPPKPLYLASTGSFDEHLAHAKARFVQLRFRSACGATQDRGNLAVFVTMQVVQQQCGAKPAGQAIHCLAEEHAIGRAFQPDVGNAQFRIGPRSVGLRIEDFIERSLPKTALAEAHENCVAGDAVQPGGKRGLPTEIANTAENREERLLRVIFCR